MSVGGAIGELEFLTKLQRILSEGLFSASYKYALLLSLAELSVEKDIAADATLRIELAELADRFIALYWRQAVPFGGPNLLAQNAGVQASAISKIAPLRAEEPTLAAARRRSQWLRLRKEISELIVKMPLWKLQRVGEDRLDFLYEERLADRGIVLRPGVAACFRSQFTIVQALVQTAWLSFVQKLPLNRPVLGSTTDLGEFLFGAERAGLRVIADGLMDLQKGTCFYCGGALRDGGEVDHFIPWSRYPRDLGHNFVLAHRMCNGDKREMLAATGHLERWLERTQKHDAGLREVFDKARFPYDADASLSVVEWSYETAEKANALVWVRCKGQTARLERGWREWFK